MMYRYCIRKCIYSILCCLGLATCASAQDFRFTTTVSNNSVSQDEPFQIQFMLENGVNVSSFTPPSFKDFEVLQGPSQMQGQSIFNGKRSDYIALSYLLQPMHVGSFTIAGAQARVNGNMVKSNPVLIEVRKGSAQQQQQQPAQQPSAGYPPTRGQQGGEDLPEGILKKGENINEKLKNPEYKLHELHFISTCISFNQEPIALFEIFQKADRKNFIPDSISFPIDSDEIPKSIIKQLEDTEANRIDYK